MAHFLDRLRVGRISTSSGSSHAGAGLAHRFSAAPALRARERALRWSRSPAWIIAGLAVLAFGLRWACVNQSLFGDELFLYVIVHDRSLGHVFSVVHDTEKTPPLGFVLGWLFARGPDAPMLMRLPSLAASVATVPLLYLLGRRTVGRGAGIVAAAWFALSPFEIFYGTEARGYALVTALGVLSTLSLLAALDGRRVRWWGLYALAAAAALHTHYIAALTVIPQAAWALWTHRESAREQLIANALVVLAWLPWLPSFVVQFRHSSGEAAVLDELAPLTLSNLGKAVGTSLAGHPFVPLGELQGRGALAVLAAALLAGVLLALGYEVRRGTRRFRPTLSSRVGLVVLLALVPVVGIVLYSLRPRTSFLLPRNLSVAVPYALLLFGWLLTYPRARVAAALSIVAVAAVAAGGVRLLSADYQRPDARDAARYIDANAPPTAPVVASLTPFAGPPARAVRLYLERPHRIYEPSELRSAWAAGIRTRAPVLISFFDPSSLRTSIPGLPTPKIDLFAPPRQYASQYRLVAEHTSSGWIPIVVRRYAPR
jgi:hypothetical protein